MSVLIRDAVPSDAGALLGIYAYYVTDTAVTFDIDVPSEEDFAAGVMKTMRRFPCLVAEEDGRIVGYAWAGTFKDRAAYDHCVEMTIYLDHACTGRGIGRALYEEMERRLYLLGYRNLYACIGYPDPEDEYLTLASPRFHERMGYVTVGRFHRCGRKFGRTYDMIWMEKLLTAPPEPA